MKRRYAKKKTYRKKRTSLVRLVKNVVSHQLEDKLSEHIFTPAGAGAQVFDYALGSVGYLVNGMSRGTGIGDRVGREVTMKRLMIQGQIERTSNSTWAQQVLRIIVAIDKEPNGAAAVPAFADCFSYNNGVADIFAFPNIATKNRFKVLYDKMINVPDQSLASNAPTSESSSQAPEKYIVRKTINLRNHKVLYNTGNAGTIADINKGALIVWCAAYVRDAVPANTHHFNYSTRLYYEDA